MSKNEIRSLSEQPTISDDGNTIEGYAAVYNSYSNDLGGFREIIRPGAFDRALAAKPDVRAYFDHGGMPLGRTKSGTLEIWADQRGLKYRIANIPDHTTGRDLRVAMKRGDVDGSSFAFRIAPNGDKWGKDAKGVVRELYDVDLHDVSVVTVPAYKATEASLRSLDAFNAEEARLIEEKAKAEAAKAEAEQAKSATLHAKQKQIEVELGL